MPPFSPLERNVYGNSPHMRNMAKLSMPDGSPTWRVDAEQQAEDEPVDQQAGQRVEQRPRPPEHRALVLRSQLAQGQVGEQLAARGDLGQFLDQQHGCGGRSGRPTTLERARVTRPGNHIARRFGAHGLPSTCVIRGIDADALAIRRLIGRHIAGRGVELGPGSQPFPLSSPGATVWYLDRWRPRREPRALRRGRRGLHPAGHRVRPQHRSAVDAAVAVTRLRDRQPRARARGRPDRPAGRDPPGVAGGRHRHGATPGHAPHVRP